VRHWRRRCSQPVPPRRVGDAASPSAVVMRFADPSKRTRLTVAGEGAARAALRHSALPCPHSPPPRPLPF
jgi:hypothetical protein